MPGLTAALLVRGVHPLRAAVPALALTGALMPLFGPAGTAAVQALQSTAVTGAEVCLIMLAGMLLHELLDEAGSHEQFGTWLATRVSRPEHRALLMALGVVPFVEAVMGFGVGVIVGFPLLVRMGFSPAAAGAVTLFGQLTIPWGAMGPGTLIASRLAGVSLQTLGEHSAALSLASFSVCGLAALVVTCGWKAALRSLPALAVVSGSLWAGIGLMNRWVGTPPAGILGSPFAIVASLLVAAWAGGAGRSRVPAGQAAVPFPARALVPYGLLAGLALLARALAGPGGASPAFPLLITCAAVPWWFKLSPRRTAGALRRTVNRWLPVAATTVAFLATGNLMRFSGMARALAGAAASLGKAYVVVAPWVGGLGGFTTGSNAGANAMFAAAQAEAARRLGFAPEWLVAAQNVSASLLTMASASRLALLVGLVGNGPTLAGVTRQVLATDAVVLSLWSAAMAFLAWR